jgi:predicted dehydrogenase
VVQDKLFLPGLRKLKRLIDGGFFGRILSVRGEFGYWVFEGDWQSAQRPSWNYRTADGGGIVLDMFPHWHYVLEDLFGPVRSVTAHVTTHIPRRVDENGAGTTPPPTTPRTPSSSSPAGSSPRSTRRGRCASTGTSWWSSRSTAPRARPWPGCGSAGSSIAPPPPRPVWNPDVPATEDFRAQWQTVPDNEHFDNGFKVQWERFLRHVTGHGPFPWDFFAGARGVQLAELGLQSAREGCRVEVPELPA